MSETTELTLPERAAVALGTAKHEKELLELVEQSKSITEIKNKDAREQCHSTAMVLRTRRTSIRKAGKDARDDATKFSKAVIAEEDRLVALIEPDETRLIGLRDVWDAEREAERQAKLAAEQARVAAIRSRIADMAAIPTILVGKSSETIAAAIESLEVVEITLDTHQEFAGEGEMAKIATLDKLREMWVAQAAVELAAADAARQAELDRIERERVAEANRIEAKRLADLAAEIERQAQAAREVRAEADRQAAAERQRIEDEERIARARAQAAMLAEQEAHRQRMAEQQAELDRKQAEIDAALAEQERVAREAREAAEATAKLEADHAEALIENAAIDVLHRLADEARREEEQHQAAEAERLRREQIQFESVGPDADEILSVLADHYDVTKQVVQGWLYRHDWAQLEKAA